MHQVMDIGEDDKDVGNRFPMKEDFLSVTNVRRARVTLLSKLAVSPFDRQVFEN